MPALLPKLVDRLLEFEPVLRLGVRLTNTVLYRFGRMQDALVEKIAPGRRILRGPFKGMIYPYIAARTSSTVPKFLGSYEEELHPFLEECFQREYATVINIGAGEGYYAVGPALKLPNARVIAFEMEQFLAELCEKTARDNAAAERVEIRGRCTPDELRKVTTTGRCLILCDCEGAEYSLLFPENLPQGKCDMFVELHDVPEEMKSQPSLEERFAATHDVTAITGRIRNPSDYQELAKLSSGERWLAVNEFRPYLMTWLYLKAR